MPPALAPSPGRVRSRTSDISDFLRGRHDPKTSSDIPVPPPVPRLPDPLTPPKSKSKFAFLGRKRKPSFSPSSAKTAAVVATAAAAIAPSSATRQDRLLDGVSQPYGGSQPAAAAGPHGRNPSRALPPLPPLEIIAPGYRPTRSSFATSPKEQYASPNKVLNNMRKQKGSFESSRRSTDSRSSMRPIITVSPPHNAMHEAADAYIAPRSAPSPSPSTSAPRPHESSLPTPTASDISDRTATPETPTSAEIPSPSTSTHSIAQLPPASPSDVLTATATSFKEESLLRRDHFEIGASVSEAQPRRGTVSFNSSNPTPPATVGFSPSRHERRHISVLQLNRLKKEITATVPAPAPARAMGPKIRKMPSDPKSLATHNQTPTRDGSSSLVRSNTIASSPPSPQGSRAMTPQQQRRIPPPLKRTWHASPPSTGPPKEPLPSPPSSAARLAQTPTSSDSFRTARSPSPVSLRRIVPPPRETLSRAQGAKSPDSLISVSIPPSPSRTTSDVETDRDGPSPSPSVRTPVREDPALQVLGDAHATREELREALRVQHEKYARLSAYLLSLTERHAREKAELMRKVESLEAGAARYEHEMMGLKWIVANAGGADASEKDRQAPVRGDPARKISTTTATSTGTAAEKAAAVRDSAASFRNVRSLASDGDAARMSFDSPAESVEEGLVELQTTISEFIAPAPARENVVPISGHGQGVLGLKTRPRRSNTVPNPSSPGPGIPQGSGGGGSGQGAPLMSASASVAMAMAKQKAARRTSSPIIPGPSSVGVSPGPSAASPSTTKQPARTGLVLGLGLGDASESVLPSAGAGADNRDNRDMHARTDSSTLSSLPSLATLHSSSSAGSGLSSIPETPRTLDDGPGLGHGRFGFGFAGGARRLSTSSVSVSSSSSSASPSPSPSTSTSTRVSASPSPSIGQVLDRTRAAARGRARAGSGGGSGGGNVNLRGMVAGAGKGDGTKQPEMDQILRRLRAFGSGSGYGTSP